MEFLPVGPGHTKTFPVLAQCAALGPCLLALATAKACWPAVTTARSRTLRHDS
jgi:hypothetical protein